MPDAAWSAEATTVQGRVVPGHELPWLRAREMMVHSVDLDCGLSFDDLPAPFYCALADDITTWHTTRNDGPALLIRAAGTDRVSRVAGAGAPRSATLPIATLAVWLTGRSKPPTAPEIPPWL
jgi:maleylpyruvate isomerase